METVDGRINAYVYNYIIKLININILIFAFLEL